MAEDSYPTEVLMYGSAAPLSAPRELKAGPLNVRYEKGSIRYVTLNGAEVVRMVYAALRDHNWDTIEPEIIAETIQSDDHSFSVSLRALYKNGDIHFEADYRISGGCVGRNKARDGRPGPQRLQKEPPWFLCAAPCERMLGQPL